MKWSAWDMDGSGADKVSLILFTNLFNTIPGNNQKLWVSWMDEWVGWVDELVGGKMNGWVGWMNEWVG